MSSEEPREGSRRDHGQRNAVRSLVAVINRVSMPSEALPWTEVIRLSSGRFMVSLEPGVAHFPNATMALGALGFGTLGRAWDAAIAAPQAPCAPEEVDALLTLVAQAEVFRQDDGSIVLAAGAFAGHESWASVMEDAAPFRGKLREEERDPVHAEHLAFAASAGIEQFRRVLARSAPGAPPAEPTPRPRKVPVYDPVTHIHIPDCKECSDRGCVPCPSCAGDAECWSDELCAWVACEQDGCEDGLVKCPSGCDASEG